MGSPFVSIVSSLGVHQLGSYNVIAWCLQDPLFIDMTGNLFHSHRNVENVLVWGERRSEAASCLIYSRKECRAWGTSPENPCVSCTASGRGASSSAKNRSYLLEKDPLIS